MNKTIALKLIGGCSNTSKMPGLSYGLPTANCKTGSKLALVKGSVCGKCYAMRGMYKRFAKTVIPAQQRRLESLSDPQWVEAMVKTLDSERWFRWFDSGDLQSLQMLENIVEVARQTPHCLHWVSTREREIVRKFLKVSPFPDNLVVRVSATYPDVPVRPIPGALMANVHKDKPPVGHRCPAPEQEGRCGTCRACWDKSIETVSYKEH